MRSPADSLPLAALLVLAACGGEHQPAPEAPEPRIVTMDELVVAVKKNLGRGTLVNVWATW